MKEEALLVYTTLNYKYKSPRKIPQKKRKERRKNKADDVDKRTQTQQHKCMDGVQGSMMDE